MIDFLLKRCYKLSNALFFIGSEKYWFMLCILDN